jgi:surface antigen
MVPSKNRARAAVASVTVALALALPTLASAAGIPAAPADAYNSTPDCPVSAASPVCSWNVPVDTNNLFTAADYGECPYWAAEKYPVLILDAVLSDPLRDNWDGSTWLEHAQLEGLTTSRTPAAGDLAVWAAEPSDISGHVAYVEAVDGSGIIVSQMDGNSAAPFPAMQGTTEYIDAQNLVYYANDYNLEYIVTGAASTTPLSNVELPAPASATTTTSASSATSDRATASASATAMAQTKALKKQAAKKKAAKKKAKKRAAKKKAKRKRHATAKRATRATRATH